MMLCHQLHRYNQTSSCTGLTLDYFGAPHIASVAVSMSPPHLERLTSILLIAALKCLGKGIQKLRHRLVQANITQEATARRPREIYSATL